MEREKREKVLEFVRLLGREGGMVRKVRKEEVRTEKLEGRGVKVLERKLR